MSPLEPAGLTEKLGGAEEVERLEQGLLLAAAELRDGNMGRLVMHCCVG